ncbi:MAG: response regulator [Myxococcota bacterium]
MSREPLDHQERESVQRVRERWGCVARVVGVVVSLGLVVGFYDHIDEHGRWLLSLNMGYLLVAVGVLWAVDHPPSRPLVRDIYRYSLVVIDCASVTFAAWCVGTQTSSVEMLFVPLVVGWSIVGGLAYGGATVLSSLTMFGGVLMAEQWGWIPVAPLTRPLLSPGVAAGGWLVTFMLVSFGLLSTYLLLTRALQRIEDQSQRIREAELARQLEDSQRLEALGRLAGGIAHDFNNLLTVLVSTASVMRLELERGRVDPTALDTIVSVCASGHAVTRKLLGLARKGRYNPERVAPDRMLEELALLLERTLSKDIVISVEPNVRSHEVEVDRGQLDHALLNLAINASHAMPQGGSLRMTSRVVRLDDEAVADLTIEPGVYVELAVIDDGVGMDEDTLARCLDPFFTTRAAGTGTGLGLGSVQGTMHSHGGALQLQSALGQGTTVRLFLPALEPSERPAPAPRVSEPTRAVQRILIVDDEELIRVVASQILTSAGHEVRQAAGGAQALSIVEAEASTIDLVLLDLSMPGMDGVETFRKIRELAPEMRVVITSGHFEEEVGARLRRQGAVAFLQKPYGRQQLLEMVDGSVRPLGPSCSTNP